jgi:zinc protease
MMLTPRFDQEALARVKQETKAYLQQASADPREIARNTRDRLLYGEDGTLARSYLGTMQTIDNITMDQIKEHYTKYFSPNIASVNIAGDIDKPEAEKLFATLSNEWASKETEIPSPVQGIPAKPGTIYFVDNPGSPQSMIFVSKPGISMDNPDYFPAFIANYRLGNGSQGMLFDILRLQKGYTYGAYSSFDAGVHYNNFTAYSSVQGSTTPDALATFHNLIKDYPANYTREMLQETKTSLNRSMASSFETLQALVGILQNISYYGLPVDYVSRQEQILANITDGQIKDIIQKHMDVNDMVFVVVGDARTQMKPLEALGMGKPILVTAR